MPHKRLILAAAALLALVAAGAAFNLPRAGAAPGWAGVLLDSPPPMGDVELATTGGARRPGGP